MDVLLAPSEKGFDVRIVDGDLERDPGLATSVVISLFSDARANPDPSRPIFEQDLRGYWGQAKGESYGSNFWTIFREKRTPDLPAKAKEIVESALAWYVDDAIARAVVVEAAMDSRQTLAVTVQLVRGSARRWASLWEGTKSFDFAGHGFSLRLLAG